MKLRKNRVHHTGLSNADLRTSLENKEERRTRLALHECSYPYHEAQLGISRVKTPAYVRPDPIEFAKTLYKTTNKRAQSQEPIGRPKSNQLRGKNLFTGGDNEPYLKYALEIGQKLNSYIDEPKQEVKRDKYHVTKELEHKKATQETQLVHVSHHNTLAGKVDLKKVADIRRTIRRRYAHRSDFRKIFNQWDENSHGMLKPDDVHRMVNRLGIHINFNEARVLVASANTNKSGSLNLDEFMQLIFDESDRMNVDLTSLEDNKVDEIRSEGDVDLLNIHEMAVNKKAAMIYNELKFQIKERLKLIGPQFIRKDSTKKDKVNFVEFSHVLNNMEFPHSISNEKTWKQVYKEFGGDDTGLNYRKFIKDMELFTVPDTDRLREDSGRNPTDSASRTREEDLVTEQPATFGTRTNRLLSSNFSIQDRRNVPVNQLEHIFQRARKIRQYLRDTIGDTESLKNQLSEFSQGNLISQTGLKDFIISKVTESKEFRVTKKELEGFLSGYIYNKDGATPVDELVNNVFLEDTRALEELAVVKRAVPPKRNADTFTEEHKAAVPEILKAIEEKMFVQGKQRSYSVFKEFDVDRDGYLTKEDLTIALGKISIPHSSQDIEALMSFLDTNKNGYVSFQEFSENIQPNILEKNAKKLNLSASIPNMQPSKELLMKQIHETGSISEAYQSFKESFLPDIRLYSTTSSTRFSAKPPHKLTFGIIQPQETTSMYANHSEVYLAKSKAPINIGAEDKEKSKFSKDIRIEYLKKTRENYFNHLGEMQDKGATLDENKLVFKAAYRADYEQRCHGYAIFSGDY